MPRRRRNDLPRRRRAVRAVHGRQRGPVRAAGDRRARRGDGGPRAVRCLGDESFERTVWFFVPASSVAAEVTVDAERPHARPDRPGAVRPARADDRAAASVNHTVPNACAGLGDGGASERRRARQRGERPRPAEPPRLRPGRPPRGGRAPEDERAVLSLRVAPIPTFTPVLGDRAEPLTPVARAKRPTAVPLANATVTCGRRARRRPCPSLGTVWRRLIPGNAVPRRISVVGRRRDHARRLHRRHCPPAAARSTA